MFDFYENGKIPAIDILQPIIYRKGNKRTYAPPNRDFSQGVF